MDDFQLITILKKIIIEKGETEFHLPMYSTDFFKDTNLHELTREINQQQIIIVPVHDANH